jgi:hypothetical protein
VATKIASLDFSDHGKRSKTREKWRLSQPAARRSPAGDRQLRARQEPALLLERAPGGVHEGDTLSADAIGDKLSLSVNGVVRASAQDSMFATGNPGVAFWRGMSGCGTLGDYGFTSFTASSAN